MPRYPPRQNECRARAAPEAAGGTSDGDRPTVLIGAWACTAPPDPAGTPGDARTAAGRPFIQEPDLGTPVESLSSIHARVAALSRHRSPEDPEVAAARAALVRCKKQTHELRSRVQSLPASVLVKVLDAVDGPAAHV